MSLHSKKRSLGVSNFANNYYIATFSIGSNKQEFKLILDTGSSNMWIPDTSLLRILDNTFNCSTSETCKSKPSDTCLLKYDKGEI